LYQIVYIVMTKHSFRHLLFNFNPYGSHLSYLIFKANRSSSPQQSTIWFLQWFLISKSVKTNWSLKHVRRTITISHLTVLLMALQAETHLRMLFAWRAFIERTLATLFITFEIGKVVRVSWYFFCTERLTFNTLAGEDKAALSCLFLEIYFQGSTRNT